MPIWATDAFRPDQWREFFQTVGTGAAALTGLIFVAMSLNVVAITANTTHRYGPGEASSASHRPSSSLDSH